VYSKKHIVHICAPCEQCADFLVLNLAVHILITKLYKATMKYSSRLQCDEESQSMFLFLTGIYNQLETSGPCYAVAKNCRTLTVRIMHKA